jgi:sarcosine oxidase subunit beta
LQLYTPPHIEFTRKLPQKADIVIIGGGVAGLAVAYGLARIGYSGSVLVLERGFLGSGSTVRNAARFRVHFFSRENTVFARESTERIVKLSEVTGVNVAVKRGGYLWLVEREDSLERLKWFNNHVWSPEGVPVRFLKPEEVQERYPCLRVEGFVAGMFGPQNGTVHYYQMILAMAYYASRNGVKIALYRPVRRVLVDGERVKGVEVEGAGTIEAGKVVVAAGSWSKLLLEELGINLPLKPVRKSLLVTEPYRYTLEPLVIDFERGSYIGQTFKGGIIATGVVKDPETLDYSRVSLKWLVDTAKTMRKLLKGGEHIRILRAWSGTYNTTPDHSHILGRSEEWPDGLYVSTGYSGHGLMMSPYAGELLAKLIAEDKIHPHMKPYLPDRFKEGRLIHETLILG